MSDIHHSPELERMKSLVDRWKKDDDRRDIFLQCYSMMTYNMISGLGAENFHDANWVGELLRHFADFYFDSLDSLDDPDAQASAV
jgi:hypothetical protein